jgi:hypothetical protein
VCGIGEQGEAAGDHTADHFDDHEARNEDERDRECTAAPGMGRTVPVQVAVLVSVAHR